MPIETTDRTKYPDVTWERPREAFTKSTLHMDWHHATQQTDNDYLAVIASSSRSRISGTGKTTLGGMDLARAWDRSNEGFVARKKATLNASRFAKQLMVDPDLAPDQSSVVFDEAQGTLSGRGADARRSMQQSVLEVATAIATMRIRQLTGIVISQSPDWIDQRIDELLDALILIQDREPGEAPKASVYETYYHDFESGGKRYTEKMCDMTWDPVPYDDQDYQYMHRIKKESARGQVGEDDEPDELPKERQKQVAQELRKNGMTMREIADSDLLTFSKSWISDNTEAPA